MNNSTEYEFFTRKIYQQLVDADTLKATKVMHMECWKANPVRNIK